jgi:hypothetical protein
LEWLLSLEEEGHDIPELKTQPELFPDLVFYYSSFNTLSTSRQSGFGIGYIPYSEISNYLTEQHIFDFEDRQDCIRWIQFIDREYVKLQHKKQDNKKPAKKSSKR